MRLTVTFEGYDFDWFIARLSLDGARRIGMRDVLVRCPAHDDYSPSLHVWEDDQGLGVHCFAGCTRAEVEAALEDAAERPTPSLRSLPSVERGPVVAAYDYRNAAGELLFRKYRHEPKDFSIRRPVVIPACEEGPVVWSERISWQPGLKDQRTGEYLVEPLPYNLPEVIQAVQSGDLVWLPDGEKDADRLAAEGLVATCSPFGMARWLPEWNEYLRGAAAVVIVADRDEAGYRASEKLARSLAGIVEWVEVYEAAVGKDVSDHLDAGHGLDELEEVILG